jgi:murine toxin
VIELDDDYYQLMPDEKYHWDSGRVLTLGRGGVLGSNASDVAKETLIKGAQHSLKICQQDLFFTGFTNIADHKVCHWIAEALLAKPNLTIDIVVSPISAATHGAQYSWGHGGTGTFAALRDIIAAKVTKYSSDTGQAATALKRLQVAPFCFTDVTFKVEGKDYFWPNAPATSVIGRFNAGDKTPLGFNYQPAPGNHAKVYIADDSCYYIGSDNLYPHDLAEFGFLIEGKSVQDLLRNYWDLLWHYSSQHIVKL